MSYTTQQDILDFVEDNNVKFVRFAFCDIFGFQKNIAVLASDLPKALEDGVCFDGSAIAGFMHVEESDLVLRPDLSTMTILPWRTAEGRVMQFFCDVEKPDNTPFGGNCRGFLRDINRRFKQMGLAPQHSHHENGHGQNEIDFHYAGPLKTADNIFLFKQIVRAVAASNGFHSSFLPKPLPDQAGSGLHINLSLTMDGKNLFEGDIAPDSIPGSFMAGILRHSRELTAFTNPLPNSYLRFGCDEAPRYVSWSRQNRSQLVRIPQVKGDNCRMELRSPDPACNPYLAIGLVLAAGLDGIEHRMELSAPVNRNLFIPGEAAGLDLETLPASLEEAVEVARNSEFLHKFLPDELSRRYYAEALRRCEALKNASDPAEYERVHYFNAI